MTAASAPLLRFITAGSVDDGKSTLIGRLLYDSKTLLTDQIDKLNRAAENGETPDFASLTDGLAAEREQGITIDVAYRYFATPKRKFTLPIRRDTSNTRVIWLPAHQLPMPPLFWSMPLASIFQAASQSSCRKPNVTARF